MLLLTIRLLRHQLHHTLALLLWCYSAASGASASESSMGFIDAQIAAHAGRSGVYVLDRGEDALLARAWLADHAVDTIEVQYFIWSSDNIGILASAALLRAAERGVQVRVIVDDLLIDAPDRSLLALAQHPNIEIRIYNPKHSVGTPTHKRIFNLVTDFRGFNQRMHNKTFIVDGKIAITGGRNMADEYYDYDQAFNFRDRDAMVFGPVVQSMRASFEEFWRSHLSVATETRFNGLGVVKKHVRINADDAAQIYRELHAYAASPAHFTPEVRAIIASMAQAFPRIAQEIVWTDVAFISDAPGKNDQQFGLRGGGRATAALAQLVDNARTQITIQSPYLVLSREAIALFARAIARGVRVRINTNSLASTDNLLAFSGYRNQRKQLLAMGLEIYEYRPDPQIQEQLMQKRAAWDDRAPIFALHAKTMVIDSATVYIGTFNLDPRSENLNTEAGIIANDTALATAVEAAIETDMLPGNSWNAAHDDPDRQVPLVKRGKARFWQSMPIKPLL